MKSRAARRRRQDAPLYVVVELPQAQGHSARPERARQSVGGGSNENTVYDVRLTLNTCV